MQGVQHDLNLALILPVCYDRHVWPAPESEDESEHARQS